MAQNTSLRIEMKTSVCFLISILSLPAWAEIDANRHDPAALGSCGYSRELTIDNQSSKTVSYHYQASSSDGGSDKCVHDVSSDIAPGEQMTAQLHNWGYTRQGSGGMGESKKVTWNHGDAYLDLYVSGDKLVHYHMHGYPKNYNDKGNSLNVEDLSDDNLEDHNLTLDEDRTHTSVVVSDR